MPKKNYLYVGHYIAETGEYILKVGTTNDLKRRRIEHNYNYRRCSRYRMPKSQQFQYDWCLPLSEFNTLRYEKKTKAELDKAEIGIHFSNDRYCCTEKPNKIVVTIKKSYEINL